MEADVELLIASALDATGHLDVLVDAAAIAPAEDEEIESVELFREALAVNATGLYACARAAARPMRAAGGGAIINVGSISGLVTLSRLLARRFGAFSAGMPFRETA